MAIEKRTIVAQIEIPVWGGTQVLIHLQLVENGKILSYKNHRTYIPADISPAEQMAHVNDHLTQMGEAKVTSSEIQRIGMFHKLAVDIPSEYAPVLSVEDMVEAIQRGKKSREVKPK